MIRWNHKESEDSENLLPGTMLYLHQPLFHANPLNVAMFVGFPAGKQQRRAESLR
jgi:hypothetical protein